MDIETRAIMREIAEEAAQNAVRQTMISLGVDHGNPLNVQRDMAALRELRLLFENTDTHKDMAHLREWRQTMDMARSKGLLALLGLLCIGGLALVVYAFGLKFKV